MLTGLGGAWLGRATFDAWEGGSALARAASVGALTLILQSAVDYPLRTETLAVLFAFCCGLLAIDRPGVETRRHGRP